MAKSRSRLFADAVKNFYADDSETQTLRAKRNERVASNTKTTLDTVSLNDATAITYYCALTKGNDSHFTIISAIEKGNNDCDYTEYGTIITNDSLADFEVGINNGEFTLYVTPSEANVDIRITRIIVR
jgi:hypothetical protein